ncbi:MAG: hypothetical protein AAF488_15140 [Planctomycetota bacterium]
MINRDRADRLFLDVAGESVATRTRDRRWLEAASDRIAARLDGWADSPEAEQACLFHYIREQALAERVDRLAALSRELRRRHGDYAAPLSHLRVLDAYFEYRAGHARQALDVLEREIQALQKLSSSCYTDYVHVQALVHLGGCYESVGNLFQTELCYRQAQRIATRRGFFKRYEVKSYLAKVLWASSQCEEAWKIHTCDEARRVAQERGEVRFLVDSSLNAAKCAIDLKWEEDAARELDRALELIEAHRGEIGGVAHGYWLLFAGELETLRGQVDPAMDLLTRAVNTFEQLDPPCHSGAIQAKTSLCHFALFEGDFRLATAIIEKLLREADEKGCPDARGRLLLLESFLFLTDEPPKRDAYDSLVSRLHLINNPALLFHALGNLYTYALEFLGEADQAFLLARIRNLRPLLKRGCYRDLYQNYVSKRYEYAIENRLARYLQNDLEGEWNRLENPA